MNGGLRMQYAILLFIAFIISFIAAWLEIHMMVTIVVIFLLTFSSLIFTKFYPILWTKNTEKTERFMKKNLKDPMIHLYYGLANGLDDEVEVAMGKILRKYKDKTKQALFKTIDALYKKNLETAEANVEYIRPLPYQHYYRVAIAIENNELTMASELIEKVEIEWMKDALQCELKQKQGKRMEAVEFAQRALEKTRGLQKYLLVKEYEKAGLIP